MTSQLYDIKQMSVEHCAQVYAIEQASQAHPWSEALIKSCLHPRYFNLVCLGNNQVAGFLIADMVVDELSLLNICVAPHARRQGIAQQLHQYMINFAKQNQVHKVWLEVRSDNTEAFNLYQKLGYQPISIRKNYYAAGVDALNMQLMLK
ncbi:ribosomal protein S18-alanine N-acetyltransferase [Catenovulum sediminis]|uniref:[Ribosomal protein bS18]-alanine N-acetyltransferase n=1 Tax=Catenovulum sediminis TaxID=1740262 RepID=A0ABV1REW2_9ALTE|nr:ribosomal protein S18-alanine N-acetyltransferase [Catenovulum sediminis]